MFRDIAVPLIGGGDDEHLLEVALSLAGHFDARLSPLQIVELPRPLHAAWSSTADPAMEAIHARYRAAASRLAERTRQHLRGREGQHAEVRVIEALYDTAWEVAAKEVRCADLAIVSRPGYGHPMLGEVARGVASLLLEAGRPILVVPDKTRLELPLGLAVVAWRSSREATRAAHDALPFLRSSASVDILAYDDEAPDGSGHQPPGQALLTHLQHHGIQARFHSRESSGIDIASLILSHAQKNGAGLVVAGGYGHSRLREWVIGGVTRELLATASIPLLVSH